MIEFALGVAAVLLVQFLWKKTLPYREIARISRFRERCLEHASELFKEPEKVMVDVAYHNYAVGELHVSYSDFRSRVEYICKKDANQIQEIWEVYVHGWIPFAIFFEDHVFLGLGRVVSDVYMKMEATPKEENYIRMFNDRMFEIQANNGQLEVEPPEQK